MNGMWYKSSRPVVHPLFDLPLSRARYYPLVRHIFSLGYGKDMFSDGQRVHGIPRDVFNKTAKLPWPIGSAAGSHMRKEPSSVSNYYLPLPSPSSDCAVPMKHSRFLVHGETSLEIGSRTSNNCPLPYQRAHSLLPSPSQNPQLIHR